jgi:drug/metabolite transporter (DMT)-like permease
MAPRQPSRPGAITPLEPASARARGVLLVLAATLCWSLSGVLVRLLDQAVGWQIILYRSIGLTLVVLAVVATTHRGRVLDAVRAAGWTGVMAGIAAAAASMLYILSLAEITVANALFMVGISPFLAAFAGRWLLGEAVAGRVWVAMLLALVGVVVMVGNGLALGRLHGNLLALGSAACFAAFVVLLRYGRQTDMLPALLHNGVISMLAASLVLATAGGTAHFRISGYDLSLCLLLGIVQLGFGSILFTRGARYVPAAELQLLSMAELALGPLWVWLAVSEAPTAGTLVGGGLVLLAIAIQALGGRGPKARAPARGPPARP